MRNEWFAHDSRTLLNVRLEHNCQCKVCVTRLILQVHYIVLYCIKVCYIVLQCVIMCYIVLQCVILCSIVLHCITLFIIVLPCVTRLILHCIILRQQAGTGNFSPFTSNLSSPLSSFIVTYSSNTSAHVL